MSEKIYPKGIMTFGARENAPEFVKGVMIVTFDDLKEFFNEQKEHLTEYNGKKQLKFNILEGNKGLYFTLDTFKPTPKSLDEVPSSEVSEDELPF